MNLKKILCCFSLLLALSSYAAEKPLVGAIRWDAWYGDGTGVNGEVEATLSVQRWQWRAPFFADVISRNKVEIRGGAKEIRKEIDFAADAGLDYWAFCIYEADDNLSRALHLYLEAPNRQRINFCMNLQGGHVGKGGLEKAMARIPLYVEYMKRPEYQTVLNGRPLIYLLYPQTLTQPGALPGGAAAVQLIQALRDQTLAAGLKNPYIVFQDYVPDAVNVLREQYGADAIGAYAANTGRLKVPAKQFQEYVETEFIPEFLKTGSDIVPLASTGFDMRPRIETGVSWDPHAIDLDINMYHEQPTPEEFADHLRNVIALLKSHPKQTPANTVLIYAWNEFDEGGWLCPTLGEGTARLDALRPAKREKPNIVFVLADDISAKDLRCYNPNGIKLPTIEKMAREGVQFQTAWSAPVCGPSRAILQTGKYPFNQGYFENYVEPNIPLWRNPRHRLIGQVMRAAGYVNAWYGKIHFGGTPVDYGFDEYCTTQWWDGYDGPFTSATKTTNGMYAVSWYWHPGLLANGKGIPTGPEDFGPQIESERILDFITRHKDRPFFVYWPSNLPHMAHKGGTPMNGNWFYTDVPECDSETGALTGKKIAGSLGSDMQFLDQKLKLIINRLASLNILDNTIIMLAGDNGTPGYGKGKFESEVALHVPFIAWSANPKWVKPRGLSPVLVDFSDILPTLAELGGAELPEGIDGRSFAPYLRGDEFKPRDWIFMQFNNARWLRDDRWLLDGYGRFYDCGSERDESTGYGVLRPKAPLGSNGPKDPTLGYRDVTESSDSGVIAARKRFEDYLKALPGPDYNDPETKQSWKRFRKSKPPIEVFRPDYLQISER